MKFSKELTKQIINLMIIAALLVMAVMYSGKFVGAIGFCINIVAPFILGGALAFIFNIPMSAIETRAFGKWEGKSADRFKRPVSLLLTVVLVFTLLGVLIAIVVPKFSETVTVVAKEMPDFLRQLSHTVAEWDIPIIGKIAEQGSILDTLSKNWEDIIKNVTSFLHGGSMEVIGKTVHVVTGIIGAVATGIIGFAFSLYILGRKETLGKQFTKLFKAYLPEKRFDKLMTILGMLNKNFKNFITGQCLDASILGVLFIVTMFILKIPYALMIGVVIGFTALIPIVGAFLGCFVGVFLIAMSDPSKVVWFLILFIILQQTEGKFIYPKVVGGSVGLPAIWVLFAVFTGAALFGVIGMLVFIPLLSTIYSLLRDDVNKRLIKKEA